MKTYEFRINRLLSVWETENVEVEAENLEDAKAQLMRVGTFDDSDTEILYETLETLTEGQIIKNALEVFLVEDNKEHYLDGVDSL